MIISRPRSRSTPTRSSGPTPAHISSTANLFAIRFNSPYVRSLPSCSIATVSSCLRVRSSNSSCTNIPTGDSANDKLETLVTSSAPCPLRYKLAHCSFRTTYHGRYSLRKHNVFAKAARFPTFCRTGALLVPQCRTKTVFRCRWRVRTAANVLATVSNSVLRRSITSLPDAQDRSAGDVADSRIERSSRGDANNLTLVEKEGVYSPELLPSMA